MLLLAVGSAVWLAAYRAKRQGFDPEVIFSVAPWVFGGGIIGARTFYVLQYRNDFIGNTLSFQPGNSSCLDIACVKKQCVVSEVWKHKLICTFPLMQWWISGTLSVVVLAITYLAEVISSIVSKKFNHYLALYSRVCCKEHHWRTVFFHAILLPLGQQMATLIYSHWIKTFVGYWQSKNTEMIANFIDEDICEEDRANCELVKKIMYSA